MFELNSAQENFEQPLTTIVHNESRLRPTIAVDNQLDNRCERICSLEGLAHNQIVFGLPKQASYIACSIPKIYEVRVELYSKESESDVPLRGSLRDRGYAVPKKVIFVDVKTLSPTEESVREALSAYLDEYEIGGYCQPEAKIDEQLMF